MEQLTSELLVNKVMCIKAFNVIDITEGIITKDYTLNKGKEVYLITIDGIEETKFVHIKVNTILEGLEDCEDYAILFNAKDIDTIKEYFVNSLKLTLDIPIEEDNNK